MVNYILTFFIGWCIGIATLALLINGTDGSL